jgi:phosphate transport system permease protein
VIPQTGARLRWRRLLSRLVEACCAASVLLALAPLVLVLWFVLAQGLPALGLDFLTQLPRPVGEPGGGMANAMLGTSVLLLMAGLLAVPLGIACAVFLAEYPKAPLSRAARFAADILNGVPSIVVGIFAYAVAVLPFRRFSALAGAFALGVMMLPIVVRTTEELLLLVPGGLREAALALGASRGQAVRTVILPAALPGILTGVLLSLARVAGETAPLLFTAFNNRFWSTRLDQPIASLPVQIFTYAISPYEEWHRQAAAGAALLIGGVLLFSVAARLVTRRLERMARG